jgi:hypothetical protein
MPNTNYESFQVSTPGSNPYCAWGIKDLVENSDVFAGYILAGEPGAPGTLDPLPVLTCDIGGVTFDDVSCNTADMVIGGDTYPEGTVVLFTLIAAADIDPDTGRSYKLGTITMTIESEGGLELTTTKPVHVGAIQSR